MKTAEQIIKDVTSDKEILDYNLLEMDLYLVIKQILKMYFNNQINKEQANIYKQQAVKQYEMNKKDYEFQQSMFQEHIDHIKSTEMQRTKLRKMLNGEVKEAKPITEARLCETLNLAVEILATVFKEEF